MSRRAPRAVDTALARVGWGAVQAIDLSSSNERTDVGTRRASESFDDPHRLLNASSVAWFLEEPAHPSRVRYVAREGLIIASRLYVPVSLLTATLVAIYVYLDRTFPYFADGGTPWVKWSHVLLPVAFLLMQLTNRRYGSGYAFAQILVSLAICDALAVLSPDSIVHVLPAAAAPSTREVIAFFGAFMAAGYLSAVAFDAARGSSWWTAPLSGAYVSSLGFAILYYPLAYAGSGASWYPHMSTHAGILLAVSLLGLFPYWLLRPAIKPLAGFGGY